jgi:hypothetical protein
MSARLPPHRTVATREPDETGPVRPQPLGTDRAEYGWAPAVLPRTVIRMLRTLSPRPAGHRLPGAAAVCGYGRADR